MNKILIIIAFISFVGCSSIDLPETKESESKIKALSGPIEQNDRAIQIISKRYDRQRDISIGVKMELINEIFEAFAFARKNDVSVIFKQTRPLISEKKSIFGIQYTNKLDINSGKVDMDLRKLWLWRLDEGRIEAELEISGKGKISVTGVYTGISTTVEPDIELSLKDKVTFFVESTDKGSIILWPQPDRIDLNLKFYVKILEWRIPYNHSVELNPVDLIKPVEIPLGLHTEIDLPMPDEKTANKFSNEKYIIDLKNTRAEAKHNRLIYETDMNVKKKYKIIDE